MSSALLEIVELANGDVVLRRANGEDEPLVNIRFSEQTAAFMSVMKLEIAKAMFQAGIQAYSDIAEQVMVDEDANTEPQTLH